jgi:nicotinamidase/pyrazinamidase
VSERYVIGETDVLLVVDVQNDFCSGGRLPVAQGEAVAPLASRIAEAFDHVLLTQDWHPPGHQSFASAHPGRRPYEVIDLAYGPQTLWPDHCIQGEPGADFHPQLRIAKAELIVRKGFHAAIDSYSAFFENDRSTPTGLHGYLRERGLRRVFLAGLAFDFCVLWSAEDARALGYETIVLEDACRSLDIQGSAAEARSRLRAAGATLARSLSVASKRA